MAFASSLSLSFRLSGLGCPCVAWACSRASRPLVASAALVPGVQWVVSEFICYPAVFLFHVAGFLFPRAVLQSWLVSFQGLVIVSSGAWRVVLLRALLGRPVVLVVGSHSLGLWLGRLTH